jgi:hypothetical protein
MFALEGTKKSEPPCGGSSHCGYDCGTAAVSGGHLTSLVAGADDVHSRRKGEVWMDSVSLFCVEVYKGVA